MTLTIKHKLTNTAFVPAVVVIIFLLPFANKAFHIDDTLFIAAAKHIQSSPADFYGFNVNWYGITMPMAEVTKNPPLACYYIALVAKLFGWSEVALHLAFLVPAVAAALGSFYLAKQFCSQPMWAALTGILTPVFLVSSSNVMCDTMMLALWVWAAAAWVWGIDKNQWHALLVSAVLIAACALTKYLGMSLILLLFIYSLVKKRKLGTWALFLMVPVVILALYQWATFALYGRGLLSDAVSFTEKVRDYSELPWNVLVGLAFTGGCLITVLFYAPLLWSRRLLISSLALMVLFLFLIGLIGRIGGFPIRDGSAIKLDVLIQFTLMVLAGLGIVWLAAADFYKSRDCKSLFLFLWILGTFFFAGIVNWTVNGRSILPMAPAVGILLVRAFDRKREAGRQTPEGGASHPRAGVPKRIKLWQVTTPLILTAIVALSVCWADYTFAGTARDAANNIHKEYRNRHNILWFQGHWGFQYYMETFGGRALDLKDSKPVMGDLIVLPVNNTNVVPLAKDQISLLKVFKFVPCRWLSTTGRLSGTGFYFSTRRPLPFAFGRVPAEEYYIFIVKELGTF